MTDAEDRRTESSGLTPAQRLDPPDPRLIEAGIVTIHDLETLQACVAYENANQQRVHILQRLGRRAAALRSAED